MKTLIELYDERPAENVISTQIFRPEVTVYLCTETVAKDRKLQEKLRRYFKKRGVDTQLVFVETAILDAERIRETLLRVLESREDCAVDIAGGTDAALFAVGLTCGEKKIPVFTYSRKRNVFYNITGAGFAQGRVCDLKLRVEDFFLMAGGSAKQGRVENRILNRYQALFEPFFTFYLRFKSDWVHITEYIRVISQESLHEAGKLTVTANECVHGEKNRFVYANKPALLELERIGILKNVSFEGGSVTLTFRDEQVRYWLRDVGSVLELYIYHCCLISGAFDDVRTSVIASWQGGDVPDEVTNEIDVMAVHGITPVFISCKTCQIKTEALNELSVLKERFGSGIAKAVIVTAGEHTRAITLNRAAQLGIEVITLRELKNGEANKRLSSLAASVAQANEYNSQSKS